jgi:Tfp pilus assembly protein PilO
MTDVLHTTRGKIGLAVAGGVLLVVAAWFLIVSPQRSKASELATQIAASQDELEQRRGDLAKPAAAVTVKPSDLYRLTKALPNDTDMPSILIDVDRTARQNHLSFTSLTPSPQVLGTAYIAQPVIVVVQGRFGALSRFLGDLRRLVTVREGRLDARGRLYSISGVDITAPDAGSTFPVVKATVTLNAYSYNSTPPAPAATPSTSTDTSSSGTVAAGATP